MPLKTRRERIEAANHYRLLYGDGKAEPLPQKREKRPINPLQPSEHQIQTSVISWWRLACAGFGLPEFALYAVPNGGRRDAISGARLKAEGVRPGIPDLSLDAPCGPFHGLRIELKRHGNDATEAQSEVLRYLSGAGYCTAICWSVDEARETIIKYLRGIA